MSLALERLSQDLRFATRMLAKQPAYALCAIATLALAIGANTAIFTVVNSVLLRPLAYRDPDKLVRVSGGATFGRFEMMQTARSFSEVAAFNSFLSDVSFAHGNELPVGLRAAGVSANFLSVLGVAPLAGRSFVSAEEADGTCTAMISERVWRQALSSTSDLAQSAARVSGVPCVIAGVLPRGFAFPFPEIDVWMPLQPASIPLQSRRNSPMLGVIGRLGNTASFEQANEEVRLLNARYAIANPGALDAKPGRPDHLLPWKDQLVSGVRTTLWMLMGAVALFLAIGCANIAGLLMVRARQRARETAVRVALGASQGRLLAQFLIESACIAITGGALGIAGAYWAVRYVDRIPGLELPRSGEIHLDATVLLFAALLSIATGIVFGLMPARLGSRSSFVHLLRTGEEMAASRGGLGLSRNLSVIVQVALSTVLLVSAVLLIVSVVRLRTVDLGFEPRNLLTMRLTLPRQAIGTDFDALTESVQSVPGVLGAAVTLTLPTTGFAGTPIWPVNAAQQPLNKRPIAVLQTVTPGYFLTMGIALRSGRQFDARDSKQSPKVAILNEAAAKRLWPAYPRENPIGRSILAGASPDAIEIVGIAADVRQAGIAEEADPGVYRPRSQVQPMSAMLAVRTGANPLAVAHAVRTRVAVAGPAMSVVAVKTMDDVLGQSEARRHGVMLLLTLFAATGLLLAGLGIYGVIAYSVATRTREFGVRTALGATPAAVLRLVAGQGMALAAVGSALGLIGAAAFARLLRSLLFEVQPADPAIFAGVAAFSFVVAAVACYLPARRAMRLDPVAALRGPGS
ncbi:MAG: ABC transporter permease [Bryobacteraceae bacterium]